MKGWRISPNVHHSMDAAHFAYAMARQFARRMGLPWRVRVRVMHTSRPGSWSGLAYGSKGKGRVLLRLNCNLGFSENREWRYKDALAQPAYPLYGAEEVLCFIAGHEFGHVIGYDGGKAGEEACNRFGYECVQAWRDRQHDAPACLI